MPLTTPQPFHSKIRFGILLVSLSGFLQIFSFPNFLLTGYSGWHSFFGLGQFYTFHIYMAAK